MSPWAKALTPVLAVALVACALVAGCRANEPLVPSDPAAVMKAESLVASLTAGFNAQDPDLLLPLYDSDLRGFDAASGGRAYGRQDIEEAFRDPEWWAENDVRLSSSFVSPDGRFAVVLGTQGALLLGIEDEHIVFEYDYLGVEAGEQSTPLTVAARSGQPGSDEALTRASEAAATLRRWVEAYNARKVRAFMACYTSRASYTDFVSPAWRVLQRGELDTRVRSDFARAGFKSRIEPSAGSPLSDAFFVSSDGRFAAAQVTYEDEKTGARPMLAILEMDQGEIGQQYNFIVMPADLMEP